VCLRRGQCFGYRLRNSHVKRFADPFEALAVARFAFVSEKDMGTIHLDGPGTILHMIFAKELHLIVVRAVHRRVDELLLGQWIVGWGIRDFLW
jgi:hypothetical protein